MNRFKIKQLALIFFIAFFFLAANAQSPPIKFQNPILAGFSPDPSICRVGDDYYLATSSFVWFPAMPVYHSKDLINWELIGHGITKPGLVNFNKLSDRSGIWAVTIRYHDGLFYLITTAAEGGGGNFYVTSRKAEGPWSDPIWLKDAPGVDPSLFWDDDGKCYYTGNTWDIKREWPAQCAIWIQELDITKKKLIGERKLLTYGHANNAGFAEGPHLYKIDGKYMLLNSEGGTDQFHAIVAHHSKTILGPYIADKINPVLSHRQLGATYPLQAIGHGDLVQTPAGDWWATVLGKRMINGQVPLSRETFLAKVTFEDGTPVFNTGFGRVLSEQERPNLPWSPFKIENKRDEFNLKMLSISWHFVRIPDKKFFDINNSQLTVELQPNSIDSLVNSSMIIRKIEDHQFAASTKLNFTPSEETEQAGMVIYRNSESYYMLMKGKSSIILIKKHNGKKEVIATTPYTKPMVYFAAKGNNLDVDFSFGETENKMVAIGLRQSLSVISESSVNRFNGPGIGMYATSNGTKTTNKARFDWFEYEKATL
ncbi:glycoside hydrolase family 43 protein [Pedobacter mucosus]|uniref:glycoside hydrolase family 43 protein n=1 Tax=Pedobacter mucosus TaxID=2895286 RepID=UPI001EE3AD95|nr:glycoside hydrolase family 43 protein [Pedobacter mucosus]UKT65776.1 glycoside hydrolase family 43 protein [Pedobacter mucosus]